MNTHADQEKLNFFTRQCIEIDAELQEHKEAVSRLTEALYNARAKVNAYANKAGLPSDFVVSHTPETVIVVHRDHDPSRSSIRIAPLSK